MRNDSPLKLRGPAAVCAAFGVASALALSAAMVTPAVAGADTTNVAQFHMINDGNSTTVAEAAKYQIVQLQYSPTVHTLVSAIHASDPGVKVLMYADPTGEGGFSVGVSSNGCLTSAQGSAGGNAFKLYNGTTDTGMTNMGNTTFDNECITDAMTQASGAGFDGVFWDEINAVPRYKTSATCINAYQASPCSIYSGSSQSGWQNNMYTFIKAAGAYDSAHGMMSIMNIGGTYDQPAVWQQWNGPVSGAMEESFVGSYTGGSVPYAQWQGEMANEQWSESNGKYEMAVHYDPGQNQESLDTYGLASMLLNAGGMTSYSSTVPTLNIAAYDWWAEYTASQSLGAPSGADTTVSSGGATVYERKFANGIVVVNPTSSASGSVALGATYHGTGNEPASATSVTLPAQTGKILTGSTPTTTPVAATPVAATPVAVSPTTPGPSTSTSTSSTTSSSGAGTRSGGGQATPVGLPKARSHATLSCQATPGRRKLTLTCMTKGGSQAPTSLRLRAYHGGHLISNHVATVRNRRVTFGVALGRHRPGIYRLVVSIDGRTAGGLTRSVRID